MPVLSEASDRVLMALHRAEILPCFEFVNLNSLAVTSDDYVTIFVFQFVLFGFYHLVHAVVDVCVGAFEIIDAQEMLSKRYDTGGIDGLIGYKTRRAIGLYQRDNNLQQTCWPPL